MNVNVAHELEMLRKEKQKFAIQSLADLKKAVIWKYGSLTNAAQKLNVKYIFLSNVLNGRLFTLYIINKLQEDLGLTNQQVLQLWPLLKTWPKEPKCD